MPGGDRTGPFGRGPRTGRGFGYCMGYNEPGAGLRPFGRGFRPGRSFGRGFRFLNQEGPADYPEQAPPMSKDDEKEFLKRTIEDLEKEIESIKSRLKKMD